MQSTVPEQADNKSQISALQGYTNAHPLIPSSLPRAAMAAALREPAGGDITTGWLDP